MPEASPIFRSRNSFGVSGLLAEGCHVFYENLSTSRNLGRVTDLLAAKMHGAAPDELRLRALLLFAFFEALRSREGPRAPVLVECGVDGERIAVGVSFRLGGALKAEGLRERIVGGSPGSGFELLLCHLHQQSERLVIRLHAPTRQIELVALLELAAAPAVATADSVDSIDVIVFEEETIAPSSPAASYTTLGDLDYASLLGGDKGARFTAAAPEVAVETRVVGVTDRRTDEAVKVVGKASAGKIRDYENRIAELEEKEKALAQADADAARGGEREAGVEPHIQTLSEVISAEEIVETLQKQAREFDAAIVTAKKEIGEFKNEIVDPRAKRWFDGLAGELMSEKSRMLDFAKQMVLALRQKELEYKNKERLLQEEIRRRDVLVRQKNSALLQTKDQFAQVATAMERLRASSHADAEDGHYRQKYDVVQKMLVTIKEENKSLQVKLTDLRGQLVASQAAAHHTPQSTAAVEVRTLRLKLDRLAKQSDEFKKMNQKLMAKLSDKGTAAVKETVGTAAGTDELKRKLVAAMKLSATYQKEAIQVRDKLEESQKERLRLETELAQALAKAA